MSVTAAERGRANRRKGADAERAVARYLNRVGFAGAQRAVRNTHPDPLDVTGIPGTVWSVKNVAAAPQIQRWLDEGETARNHQGAELAILVVRRAGKAEAARWWAWVRFGPLARAVTGARTHSQAPVCLELGELVGLLHAAGYGDPAAVSESA